MSRAFLAKIITQKEGESHQNLERIGKNLFISGWKKEFRFESFEQAIRRKH